MTETAKRTPTTTLAFAKYTKSLRNEHFLRGIRFSIGWLHERADEMNDQRARAILNSAAFELGIVRRNKREQQARAALAKAKQS